MADDASQLSLTADEKDPPDHRVRALAGILAGFGYGATSFERLTKVQQNRCYDTARAALKRLQEEE